MDSHISIRSARFADIPALMLCAIDDPGRPGKSAEPDARYSAAHATIEHGQKQTLAVGEAGTGIGVPLPVSFILDLSRHGARRTQADSKREMRGRGLGKKMLDWPAGKASERGCGAVHHSSDRRPADAHVFHEGVDLVSPLFGFNLFLGE